MLVLGGDMTGKGLMPIIASGSNGTYSTHLQDQRHQFEKEQIPAFQAAIRERGLYPFVTTEPELAELRATPDRLEHLFHESILSTVERWMQLADERLAGSDMRVIVCPGNDDIAEVDEVLRASSRVQVGEGEALDLNGYQVVSTGWSNPTPWNTYREEPEEQLAQRIDAMLQKVDAPAERLIFNFHCPPHGTPLDEAPELTEDLEVVGAGRDLAHVGSTAVRQAIENVQPLVALHGHIHEARATTRLGRTLAVNPGSSYEQGVLLGAVLEVDGGKKLKRYRLTSG